MQTLKRKMTSNLNQSPKLCFLSNSIPFHSPKQFCRKMLCQRGVAAKCFNRRGKTIFLIWFLLRESESLGMKIVSKFFLFICTRHNETFNTSHPYITSSKTHPTRQNHFTFQNHMTLKFNPQNFLFLIKIFFCNIM